LPVVLPEGVGDLRLSFYSCLVISELFRSLKQVVENGDRPFLLRGYFTPGAGLLRGGGLDLGEEV
jgi:hypothetical protein